MSADVAELRERLERLEAKETIGGRLREAIGSAVSGGVAAAFIVVFLPWLYVQDEVVAHRFVVVDSDYDPVVIIDSSRLDGAEPGEYRQMGGRLALIASGSPSDVVRTAHDLLERERVVLHVLYDEGGGWVQKLDGYHALGSNPGIQLPEKYRIPPEPQP